MGGWASPVLFTAASLSKKKAGNKALVVKGGSGLSRRQAAALRANMGVEFPMLPSLVTRPREGSFRGYVSELSDRVTKSSIRGANPFLRMLINPFEATSVRYPDESIVPSGMVHLTTSTTYTVSAAGATSGVLSLLNWKARAASTVSPNHATFVPPVDMGGTGYTWSDYGLPQSAWSALSAVDRTLACAIRVRLVGLPTSTFKPAGTIYFIQYQPGETSTSFDTESECIQAVTAKKGFSLTVAELDRLGAVHIPFLPQGPMSYVFSGTNADPPSGIPDSSVSSSVVAPNGGLFVIAFGLQVGAILRYDYSHHIEYIPRVAAAGLIETKVALPSSAIREEIAHGSQVVLNAVGGGTSASDLHVLRGGPPPPGGAFGGSSGSAFDTILSTVGLVGKALPGIVNSVRDAGWI